MSQSGPRDDPSSVAARSNGTAHRDSAARLPVEDEMQALRVRASEQHALLDDANDLIYTHDLQGKITYVNKAGVRTYGYSREELLTMNVAQIVDPESLPLAIENLARMHGTERTEPYEALTRTKDGEPIWVEVSTRLVRSADGTPSYVQGIARDIGERKRSEASLQESERLYRQLFQSHSAVQVLVDMESRVVVEPNAAACAFYGYDRDEFIGMPIEAIDSRGTDDRPDLIPEATEQRRIFARRHTLKSGETRDVDVFIGPVDVQGRSLLLVIVQDVTERKRAERELANHQHLLEEKSKLLELALATERERARRDTLTGALNHAAIAEALRAAIARDEQPVAVAMVDVDDLKATNDTYGHQMGDALLVTVARSLTREGALVGRFGGDEFLVILPGADRQAAERYRDDVMESLANAGLSDPSSDATIPVVASMGLATYPEEARALEDLIAASDNAMYSVKRQRASHAPAGAGSRALASDRAARMVGEIVPFLTSTGVLDEKLRLVAARLTTGAGYVGVSFALFPEDEEEASDLSSFAEAPNELVEKWDETDVDEPLEEEPLRPVLDRTQRPVIIDDISSTPFVNESRRTLLLTAGIHSAIVAPMVWQGKVVGTLSAGGREVGGFGPRDAQFLNAVATQVTAIVRTASLVDELQSASSRLLEAHTDTVLMLASAAEAHDHSTGRHLHRVRSITEALARELGHDDESAKEIGLAAVLHDIGKIRVPEYVLTSADSLGDDEWALMKHHTVWGGEFLGTRPGFGLAASVARCHHERWDGSGYPAGLAGEQIPEAAAITSVADSLDAMTNDRPYRRGRPLAEAIVEVQAWSGRQFSPRVVDALTRLFERGALATIIDGDAGVGAAAEQLAA